jgi:hypothetical protein
MYAARQLDLEHLRRLIQYEGKSEAEVATAMGLSCRQALNRILRKRYKSMSDQALHDCLAFLGKPLSYVLKDSPIPQPWRQFDWRVPEWKQELADKAHRTSEMIELCQGFKLSLQPTDMVSWGFQQAQLRKKWTPAEIARELPDYELDAWHARQKLKKRRCQCYVIAPDFLLTEGLAHNRLWRIEACETLMRVREFVALLLVETTTWATVDRMLTNAIRVTTDGRFDRWERIFINDRTGIIVRIDRDLYIATEHHATVKEFLRIARDALVRGAYPYPQANLFDAPPARECADSAIDYIEKKIMKRLPVMGDKKSLLEFQQAPWKKERWERLAIAAPPLPEPIGPTAKELP